MSQPEIFPVRLKSISPRDVELAIATAIGQLAGSPCTVNVDRIEFDCDGDCQGDAIKFEFRVYQSFAQSLESQTESPKA
jgi:hypothetical protein